jgi:hypothetical protein
MPNSYTPLTLAAGSASPNGTSQLNYGPFDFEYLNKDDIKFAILTPGPLWVAVPVASVNETTKIITLSGSIASQYPSLTITSARVYRATTTNALVDFTAGSRISESDLDTAYRQGLFAAQEASEDAAGSASRVIITNSDIQDGAVGASKLATDAVEAVKIKDGVVGATKLASTLNLSGKTLTIPTASVTQAAVTQHATAVKGAIDISSGMTGVLPAANGGNPNNLLESFQLPCDGIAFSRPNGVAFTSQTVASHQDLTNIDAVVNGSSVTYTPPSGTKIVVYEFSFVVGADSVNDDAKASFKLFLDSDEVTAFYSMVKSPGGNDGFPPGWQTVKYAFRIGEGDNAGSGRVNTWTSNKTITLKGVSTGADVATCHRTFHYNLTAANTRFVRPLIGITALS